MSAYPEAYVGIRSNHHFAVLQYLVPTCYPKGLYTLDLTLFMGRFENSHLVQTIRKGLLVFPPDLDRLDPVNTCSC